MTDFLYPFLEHDERDAGALLEDLSRSATTKAAISDELRAQTLATLSNELAATAAAMAERFGAGGRLYCFGNGGSSTDAAGLVDLFSHPPHGLPLPARSLVADQAVLTALANDVGYDLVFSRQLMSTATSSDIALGLSTSGSSSNLVRAFAEGRRMGMLTVGLAGYHGGAMAKAATIDHCLVVQSDSVHRIQEAQSAVVFDLWARVQRALAEDGLAEDGLDEDGPNGR